MSTRPLSSEKKSTLSKVFSEPMIVFRQPDSLRSLLVRDAISKLNLTPGHSRSCGDKMCKCYKQMHRSSLFTSTVTEKRYKIFCNVRYKSANVIFVSLSIAFSQPLEQELPNKKAYTPYKSTLQITQTLPRWFQQIANPNRGINHDLEHPTECEARCI